MKVCIQKERGEWVNVNCYTAWKGFEELGYEIVSFERETMDSLPREPEAIVVGNIGVVHAALDRLGIRRPPIINIPDELLPFCGRRIWETTLAEVHSLADVPVFVKPLQVGKAFDGHVVRAFRDLIQTAAFPDDLPVLASEPVNFVSEYRAFVLRREFVSIKHYKGDFRVFPDVAVFDAALAAYETAPVAYSLDFGVTDDRRTLLIETNDAHSLGGYGLMPIQYARLIEARWQEIVTRGRE